MIRKTYCAAFAAILCAAPLASKAEYPERPLRLVVPFSAGTSTDALARDLGQAMSTLANQPVVVDNRPGAEGVIGGKTVATAAPDGYTVMLTSSSVSVLDPLLRKSPIIDPVKDFTPVCSVARIGLGLYIRSGLPYKTLDEFIAAAKAEPDKYTFGYASTLGRMAAELFQQQAGVKLRGIPYKSTVAAISDVAAGQVDMIVNDSYGTDAHFRAGKLRPLVVASPQRLKTLPNVPTGSEAGMPGFEMVAWYGVFLPANTPVAVTNRLRETVKKAIATPAQAAMREKSGMDEFTLCGEALTKFQVAEMDRWRSVIKKSGIQPQ